MYKMCALKKVILCANAYENIEKKNANSTPRIIT